MTERDETRSIADSGTQSDPEAFPAARVRRGEHERG